MGYRTIMLLMCIAWSCSSQQESTDTTAGSAEEGATTTETVEAAPLPEEGVPTSSTTGAGECIGEPWETVHQDLGEVSPPQEYLACSVDDECTEQRMVGCCGSFAVAVNGRFRHCIAERNSRANCRAHCAMPGPDDVAPARRSSCVEGACRMVLEDESARQVIRLPWDPNL